jgi:hypothetical protein
LNFCISVPCEFDTPIVITVGGKPVNISPDSFNFGHDAEEGPDRCLGGAASTTELPDSKLAPMSLLLRTELTAAPQIFGFLVTVSSGTFTPLGMLTRAASALPIFVEKKSAWYRRHIVNVPWGLFIYIYLVVAPLMLKNTFESKLMTGPIGPE